MMNPPSSALQDDELRPEYDFSGGEHATYAAKLRERGYTIRVYQPDGAYTEWMVLGEKMVGLEPDTTLHPRSP